VGVVVVGEAAGGDHQLVEVGAEAALDEGVAAGVAEQGEQAAGAQGLAGAGLVGGAGLLAQREQQAHATGGPRARVGVLGRGGGAERVHLRGLAGAREQVDDGGALAGALGRGRGGPAAALVGGVDERELGEDLAARGLAEVVDDGVVAAEAAERGRGQRVGGEALDDAAGVVEAADDEHGAVRNWLGGTRVAMWKAIVCSRSSSSGARGLWWAATRAARSQALAPADSAARASGMRSRAAG
jgi:hypothetical protein